jgi:hypothetical protein
MNRQKSMLETGLKKVRIKHWLTSHEELLPTPGFRFKIIKTFQDPLSHQLAEAVRIDLRQNTCTAGFQD